MGTYRAVHACGHEVNVEVRGRTADVEQRLVDIAQTECADCKRAHEDERLRQQEMALGLGELPALSGSDKQVSWARQLRMTMAASAARELRKIAESEGLDDTQRDLLLTASLTWICAHTESPWYIARKNEASPTRMLRSAVSRDPDEKSVHEWRAAVGPEIAAMFGAPPEPADQDGSVAVVVRLPPDTASALRALAASEGTSVAAVATEILNRWAR